MKINIKHAKCLEPFLNFYVKNSPDVKGKGWKEWEVPTLEKIEERIEKYKEAWVKYEDKVLRGISDALNLEWKKDIDVYVVAGLDRSFSNPIVIGSQHLPVKFILELTEELTHRIFEGEDFKFSKILLNKTDNKVTNNHILIYAVIRKIFENEPEILKLLAYIKNEDYKKAYDLSENYDEILKYFRDN